MRFQVIAGIGDRMLSLCAHAARILPIKRRTN
jgi:hypothetical protein